MTNYEVTLRVKVTDIEDENYHFHYDTKDFLVATTIIKDAEVVEVREIND